MAVLPVQLSEEYSDITVIIPTFNESGTIVKLISELLEKYPGLEVVVADDGSEDGTQEQVKSFKRADVRLLDRSFAKVKGITASVLEAIELCSTRYFIVMDGDFQHPTTLISGIAEKLRKRGNLVIGTRMSSSSFSSRYRQLVSLGATFLARCFLLIRKVDVGDPMSGCFGANTLWMKKLILSNRKRYELSGYKILFDTLKVLPSDFKIEEVGYRFAERPEGTSKFRLNHVLLLLRSLVR